MTSGSSSIPSTLRGALEAAGQAHLVEVLERAESRVAAGLVRELERVDLELVGRLRGLVGEAGDPGPSDFEPPTVFPLERDAGRLAEAAAAGERGAELLASGRVAFLLVAGGQASRLGYDGPKGAYPIGPVSERSLFGWHAARLRAAGRRFGFRPLWLVMTSRANEAATRAHFEQHDWFGFERDDVEFFSQAMLPALDLEGRILRARPDALFLAPNGHGGALEALATSGALERARERGVQHLSYFQVDNPLARMADPLFLGLHQAAGARMSTKVVAKRDAAEKVGVIGRMNGELSCIEYSDLPDRLRDATDGQGRLLFGAGNIAIHVIDLDFVHELTAEGLELPWHLARKRMQVVDAQDRPAEVEGVKFETFVFDALARAGESVTLEVDRTLEFSPVKNREGSDSPESCRRDLGRLFAGWAGRADCPSPPRDEHGAPAIEVDPLLAEDLDQFLSSGPPAPATSSRGHLYGPSE